MIVGNPSLPLSYSWPDVQKELNQSQIIVNYKNLLKITSQMQSLQKFHILESKKVEISRKIGNGKLISKKMRTKLINWLEKLAFETFQFSVLTFIQSIQILDHYLSLTNEPSSSLQLIGCACLYLSSKNYESTIVAAQCYVTASANCFTNKNLFDKEMQIYSTLGFNTNLPNIMRVYKTMKQNKDFEVFNSFNDQIILKIFVQITKNTDFLEYQNQQIISMICAFSLHEKRIPNQSEILEYLRVSKTI